MSERKVAIHVRTLLSSLLRRYVKTGKDRAQLAEVLGQSVSNVKNMIYRGEGSMDCWVTAFSHYLGFEETNLDEIKKRVMRLKPATPSDNIYFELSEKLDQDRLYYYMRLVKAAAEIEKDLKKKKAPAK